MYTGKREVWDQPGYRERQCAIEREEFGSGIKGKIMLGHILLPNED